MYYTDLIDLTSQVWSSEQNKLSLALDPQQIVNNATIKIQGYNAEFSGGFGTSD